MSGRSLALAMGICLAAGAALAAERPPQPPERPPSFRRVYVPAAEIERQTWRDGYLPVAPGEFERLVESTVAGASGSGAWTTRIEKADYELQLEGDDLLVGAATLRLARPDGVSAPLVLDPCNLAIGGAHWRDAKEQAAVLGTGPDGRLRAAVDGRQLELACSLRGERTASGAVAFRLELPEAPLARLVVEVPTRFEVAADQGIVSRGPGSSERTGRWTIELGGHNRLTLRVVSEEGARERRRLTLVRQALEYQFSLRGVNVSAQLKLDVHGEPLERLSVDLDPSLRLVAARYGDQNVPWSALTDVETRVTHVILQLPERIDGTGRVLQLSAVCPLTSGKPWRLPTLQTEGVNWQEGTATLLVPEVLAIERLVTDGCRQSRVAELPAPAAGESIEIQYYRPGGSIEVELAPRHEKLRVDSGSLVEISPSEIASRAGLRFSLGCGEQQALELAVNSGWIIDAVEDWQSDKPLAWEVEELPGGAATLKIQLTSGVTPEHPVQLLVRGRRRIASGAALGGRQLEMLELSELGGLNRLLSIKAADGWELRWGGGDELNRRDALGLSAGEAQLFAQAPSGLLFVDDAVFTASTLALERRRPSFTADIRLDAAVQKDTLTETCTIGCVPESARVERLLVQFSVDREVPLEWSLAGGNSGQFSARRLAAGEQRLAGLAGGGEVWELNLRVARPGAFELRGVRSVPFCAELPLALVSVAEASSQRGSLAIRAGRHGPDDQEPPAGQRRPNCSTPSATRRPGRPFIISRGATSWGARRPSASRRPTRPRPDRRPGFGASGSSRATPWPARACIGRRCWCKRPGARGSS